MSNYATLKSAIQQVIKTNGNNEITGALLQQSLLSMINSLGVGYQFVGIATPSTNPGTPDQNVFYLASTAGTYTNFNGLVLADGEIAILKYNGAWSKDSTGAVSKRYSLIKAGTITRAYLIFDLPHNIFYGLDISIISCANPGRPIYFFGFVGETYDELGHFTPNVDGYNVHIYFPVSKVYERLRIVEAGGDKSTNTQCSIVLQCQNIESIVEKTGELIRVNKQIKATTAYDIAVKPGQLVSVTFLSSSNTNRICLFGIKVQGYDTIIDNAVIGVEYTVKVNKEYAFIRLYCLQSNIVANIRVFNISAIQDSYLLTPYPNIVPVLGCGAKQTTSSKDYYFPALQNKSLRVKLYDNLPNNHTFHVFGMITDTSWDDLVICQSGDENVVALTTNYRSIRIYQQQAESNYDIDFVLQIFDKDIIGQEETNIDVVDRLPVLTDNPLAEIKREPGYGSIIHSWGIIGDSLSSGCTECRQIGTSGKIFLDLFDYSWGQRLFKLLGVEGYNFSYSGQQAKPWCLGWTAIQTTSVPPSTTPNPEDRIWDGETVGVAGEHGAEYHPKQGYIIALGVNDGFRQEYPLGTIEDIDLNDYTQNANSFYGYYAGIIQRVRSIAPRCFVFCVTRPDSGGSTTYDAAIRKIVNLFDRCYCIDLANGVSYGSLFHGRYYLGGHLNAAGYEYTAYVMNTYIDWIIRNNFADFQDAALVNTQYEIVPT